MVKEKKWNVTFKREGGKWSVPKVFSSMELALKTMRWDDRGYKMSGEYDIEIRRGRTRKGVVLREYKRK